MVCKLLTLLQGGNFVNGNASEDMYFPDKIMEFGNVVLVTVSYRVGPLGFLCLGSEAVSGNQGLWDQRMALKWIKDNIKYFGGDPDHVTLAGQDAGSVCISYHMVSEKSAGLFAKAICMSGTFASPGFTFDKSPEVVGKAFAEGLGCLSPEDSPNDILLKLQSVR